MNAGRFRFAIGLAVLVAVAAVGVAVAFDLPLRDPDGAKTSTYVRLPLILLAAFLVDVLPPTLRRARSVERFLPELWNVVRERWPLSHVRFALVGLGAWYVVYVGFRNLKSYVPFVNSNLYDPALLRIDHALFLGQDPARVLHDWFGINTAAHFFSFVYVAWIVLVPASLVVALVWSRDVRAGEWYVTAVAVDWVLGVATYFAVPTLGPVYAAPEWFERLPSTWVSHLQSSMIQDRVDVVADPWATSAVQTIAAFASLHVGISVTMCVMAALVRLPRTVQAALWGFLVLTVLATVYLGWHYASDVLGGALIGAAAVVIAAWGTGNHHRGLPRRLEPRRGAGKPSHRDEQPEGVAG